MYRTVGPLPLDVVVAGSSPYPIFGPAQLSGVEHPPDKVHGIVIGDGQHLSPHLPTSATGITPELLLTDEQVTHILVNFGEVPTSLCNFWASLCV
jgi:hypothetical protein